MKFPFIVLSVSHLVLVALCGAKGAWATNVP